MKLYLLVEGISSEMQVYPQWISHLVPTLICHKDFNSFRMANSGFYIVSGEGYPSIINHISNAIKDVTQVSDTDALFIIVDADDDSIENRRAIIENEMNRHQLPDRLHYFIVIQNKCFETILLGNNTAIPRIAGAGSFAEYFNHYDVSSHDPENMESGSPEKSVSQYHYSYAKHAFREKRIRYTKSNCNDVANSGYIDKIVDRTQLTNHLESFKYFIESIRKFA